MERWLSGQRKLLHKPSNLSSVPNTQVKVGERAPKNCPLTSTCACGTSTHKYAHTIILKYWNVGFCYVYFYIFHNVPLTVYKNYKLCVLKATCSWSFTIPFYLTWGPILGKRSNSVRNSLLGCRWNKHTEKMVISNGLLNYCWSLLIAFWNLSCYALKKRACYPVFLFTTSFCICTYIFSCVCV